jgi:hypothetical protein
MIGHSSAVVRTRPRPPWRAAVLCLCALASAGPAPAQEPQPATPPAAAGTPVPSAAAPSAPPGPVTPAFQPGFIDAVGRWLEQGAARMKSDMQGAQENLGKVGDRVRDAAKDATGAVGALPGVTN